MKNTYTIKLTKTQSVGLREFFPSEIKQLRASIGSTKSSSVKPSLRVLKVESVAAPMVAGVGMVSN